MNCASCGAALPEGAMFCGSCGRAVNAAAVPRSRIADPRPGDTTILPPGEGRASLRAGGRDATTARHAAAPLGAPGPRVPVRADETQTPDAAAMREGSVPYVLSFSTGERVVVVGTGLLGRRPFAQPGERFDQIVSIADRERSVSKTHLEFGLEGGDLWVCDRYSANGTVIIPPAGAPRRCEPGRRYRVPRGGRVEIGDHWFDVR